MSARPPAWAVLGTLVGAPLFIGTVIAYVPYALTGWRFERPVLGAEPSRWIGAALIVVAVPVMLDFIIRFVIEGLGTPMPMAPPRRLVVSGAFRYVRNPGYLAALGVIAGQGLLFGSAAVLVYAVVMALVFHLFVVVYEEPTLRRTFGDEYEAYRLRVPRWVPRIPPRP